jgi:large subunit ribosomal protein L19
MEAIAQLEKAQLKPQIPSVQSGDTVKVHQVIREGSKKRVQVFEGVVIRTSNMGSLTASIKVRRIASGVGVEKTFLLHSPNLTKVVVVRRSKVRRNFLSYLRQRRGKSARLQELSFDRQAVNAANEAPVEAKADEPADAEITELVEEAAPVSEMAQESTEELAKEENKAAANADPEADNSADDEQLLPAEEASEGVDEAGEAKA